MTGTHLEVFDSTLHKAHAWLEDIMAELGWADRHTAYLALRAALHALRDRLTIEEASHLGAQLPMLIRGLYYEGWRPSHKPIKSHRAEFLADIRNGFRGAVEPDPDAVARAVFAVLARHVSEGEITDVKNILPKELRELLPETPPAKSRKSEPSKPL